jgi:diguanylate cyclase (GGDEF)-like protein
LQPAEPLPAEITLRSGILSGRLPGKHYERYENTMKDLSLEHALALLDISPIAMLLTAADGRIRGCNQAFAGLLGETADTLAGQLPDDGMLAPLLGQGTLINWIMPDGDTRWLALETFEIDAEPGSSARFYLDVTEKLRFKQERDALASELQAQSLYDASLVSLFSRHGVLVSLRPLVARSRRYNSPLSVVTMRIDSAADTGKALTRIAHLLRDQTRWADLVGCNAGRDFILVLQETTRDAAEQLVQKLAAHLERMNAETDQPVQACYGITQCQKDDDEASILERAESALAQACQRPGGTAIAI